MCLCLNLERGVGEATGGAEQQITVGVGPNKCWLSVTPPHGIWCDHSDRPVVLLGGGSFDLLRDLECGLYMVQCMKMELDLNVITPFISKVCGLIPHI